MKRKLRIGLLVEEPAGLGGIQSAADRHARLLADDLDIVPIAFDRTADEKYWAGRVERVDGKNSYLIIASDLKTDLTAAPGAGQDHLRSDMRYRSYADRLIELVERERLDMLHSFGLFHQRGMLAAFAAAKCSIPYILSFRGVDLEIRIFDAKSLPHVHAAMLGAQSIVCVSADSERLVKQLFRPSCPTYVVRNHFDPRMFVRKKVSIPLLRGNTLPVIGSFGRFRRVTGLDFLLRGFDSLNEHRPAVLLLVGDFQKHEAEFHNFCFESMKHGANVLRINYVQHSEVLNYMRLCDAIVFPSISDASPNKLLEAMYAKVPIVATRVGGIPEMVSHGREALLVPPRSSEHLAEAMDKVLTNKSMSKCLADAAYRRVTQEFAIEAEKPLWVDIYRRSYEGFVRG